MLVNSANGFTNTGVTSVASGVNHSLAIQNGSVYTWGQNVFGALGDGTTTNSAVPVAVSSLSSGVTDVAAGGFYSLAVQNGHVYAWGSNDDGRLGDGTTNDSVRPLQVAFNSAPLSGIVQVAAGLRSSFALGGDGSLYVWGYNADGELGLGNKTTPYTKPHAFSRPPGSITNSIDANGYGYFTLTILGSTPPVPLVTPTLTIARYGTAGPTSFPSRRRPASFTNSKVPAIWPSGPASPTRWPPATAPP